MNEQTSVIDSLTRKEAELLCFSGNIGYHTRLQQYLEYPQGFAARTTPTGSNISLSTTKTFCCYLRRFIRDFRPEPLLPSGDLWLHLEKSGRFSLRLGVNGEEITDSSEAEFLIFQYLCFLQMRRFWNTLRKHYLFPATTLPVFIRDFSARLDENMDYDLLLRRALDVSKQVVVL